MQEAKFARGLMDEIKRSKDPRFHATLAWCSKIAKDMNTCDGDAEKQELHVAVVTWELLIGIGELEETLSGEVIELPPTSTYCNQTDLLAPKHELQIDFVQKTITITATFVCFGTIILPINMVTEKLVDIEPLVLPLSGFAQACLEAQKETT